MTTKESNKPVRVIITDDHSLFRMGLRQSLSSRDDLLVIGEAENGLQLLGLLKTLEPDVITLNLQMPVLDGFETLPVLRERYPHIKVLMVSMHNDPGTIRKAIELGAHSYLTKEAGSGEIYEAVRLLGKNWFYVNRTVAEALLYTENELNPVKPEPMSEKDKRFLGLLCAGHTDDQLSRMLELRPATIAAYINKLVRICGVKDREELIQSVRSNEKY